MEGHYVEGEMCGGGTMWRGHCVEEALCGGCTV